MVAENYLKISAEKKNVVTYSGDLRYAKLTDN